VKVLNLTTIVRSRDVALVAHIADMTYGHGGVKQLDELNYELFKTYMRSPARYVVNTDFIRRVSESLMLGFGPSTPQVWGRVDAYVNKASGGDSVPFEIDDTVPDGVIVAILTA
jgi:hypothetical protein